MSTPASVRPPEYHTFGLPVGSVRGFLSVLICSFFWIVLLVPSAPVAPLGHFFLLTMVFLAFASHPALEDGAHILPWFLRVLFVGGSVVVVAFAVFKSAPTASERLTPAADQIKQWPVLLGCLAGGFGMGLFLRFILGRRSDMFMTLRAWVGVIAMLLLFFETLLQFLILPNMDPDQKPDLKIWEGVLIAAVAGYFGSRA